MQKCIQIYSAMVTNLLPRCYLMQTNVLFAFVHIYLPLFFVCGNPKLQHYTIVYFIVIHYYTLYLLYMCIKLDFNCPIPALIHLKSLLHIFVHARQSFANREFCKSLLSLTF